MDLRDVVDIPDKNFAINASMQRDPRLGISIGVLLSVLCVAACAFIIIRHRRCSKTANHQHVNGNGGNTVNAFSNRSPATRGPTTGATTLIPTTSTQIPNCNADAHEMQTLIVPSIEHVSATNGNGAAKNHDIHMNGILNAGANRHSFSTTNTHSTDDENSDLSRCGLISSTPKSKHKPIIVKNDHLKNASTNFGSHTIPNACNDVNPPYRRIDCDVEAHCGGEGGGEMATNLFSIDATDQLTKTTLPPNKSVHSIMYNNMNEIPPTIKRLPNTTVAATMTTPTSAVAVPASVKNAKRSSANMSSSTSITSILDDSQQCLLPDPNATESSSASTSSGCVPMDRITNNTNCVFDIATFDNGAVSTAVPHPIVENQRYMRSAALV